jgi:hypothetical protein
MDNAATDPSIKAIDIDVTGTVVATMPMASTTTTAAVTKPKVKVTKEVTAKEGEFQNQKRQVHAASGLASKEGRDHDRCPRGREAGAPHDNGRPGTCP